MNRCRRTPTPNKNDDDHRGAIRWADGNEFSCQPVPALGNAMSSGIRPPLTHCRHPVLGVVGPVLVSDMFVSSQRTGALSWNGIREKIGPEGRSAPGHTIVTGRTDCRRPGNLGVVFWPWPDCQPGFLAAPDESAILAAAALAKRWHTAVRNADRRRLATRFREKGDAAPWRQHFCLRCTGPRHGASPHFPRMQRCSTGSSRRTQLHRRREPLAPAMTTSPRSHAYST